MSRKFIKIILVLSLTSCSMNAMDFRPTIEQTTQKNQRSYSHQTNQDRSESKYLTTPWLNPHIDKQEIMVGAAYIAQHAEHLYEKEKDTNKKNEIKEAIKHNAAVAKEALKSEKKAFFINSLATATILSGTCLLAFDRIFIYLIPLIAIEGIPIAFCTATNTKIAFDKWKAYTRIIETENKLEKLD